MKNEISLLLGLTLVAASVACNSSKEGEQSTETTSTGGNDGGKSSTTLPSYGGSGGTHPIASSSSQSAPSNGGSSSSHLSATDTSTGGHSTNNTDETTPASGGTGPGSNTASSAPPTSSNCETVLPLHCGDRLNHSTITQGRANQWSGYSRTQRLLNGRETVYCLMDAKSGSVSVQLVDITEDLDLLLLPSCDPMTNTIASSTPLDLQTNEAISFTTELGKPYYVVVDGYAGAEGSYTLQVDCVNP